MAKSAEEISSLIIDPKTNAEIIANARIEIKEREERKTCIRNLPIFAQEFLLSQNEETCWRQFRLLQGCNTDQGEILEPEEFSLEDSINTKIDDDQFSPLVVSITFQRGDVVEALLACPDLEDNLGQQLINMLHSPFHNDAIARMLIQHPKTNINHIGGIAGNDNNTRRGLTALAIAVIHRDIALVTLILQQTGINIDMASGEDINQESGNTALHFAVKSALGFLRANNYTYLDHAKALKIAKFLIAMGINTELTNRYGTTALTMLETALLSVLDLPPDDPAHVQKDRIMQTNLTRCQAMLTVLRATQELFVVAATDDTKRATELLALGPSVFQTANGNMPLHIACKAGKSKMAAFLVAQGDKIFSTNEDTPCLITRRSQIFAEDNQGRSPLQMASDDTWNAIVNVIPDLTVRNIHGHTVLDVAVAHHLNRVPSLLKAIEMEMRKRMFAMKQRLNGHMLPIILIKKIYEEFLGKTCTFATTESAKALLAKNLPSTTKEPSKQSTKTSTKERNWGSLATAAAEQRLSHEINQFIQANADQEERLESLYATFGKPNKTYHHEQEGIPQTVILESLQTKFAQQSSTGSTIVAPANSTVPVRDLRASWLNRIAPIPRNLNGSAATVAATSMPAANAAAATSDAVSSSSHPPHPQESPSVMIWTSPRRG